MSDVITTNDAIALCDDTDLLLSALKQCAVDILGNLERMAAILRRLDELGVEVTLDHALIPYIRMIANGQLSASCLVACAADPQLLEKAVRLPIAAQEKIAKDEPLVVLRDDGTKKDIKPSRMNRRELNQAYGDGFVRSEEGQRKWLNTSAIKSKNCRPRKPDEDQEAEEEVPGTKLNGHTLPVRYIPSQRSSDAMDAEIAEAVAKRVMIHLYRGSIEYARAALEDGWRSHVLDKLPLPVGIDLRDEPLSRVCDNNRLVNCLEENFITTVGDLLDADEETLQAIPMMGEFNRKIIDDLRESLGEKVADLINESGG